jgi:hypothetical protein
MFKDKVSHAKLKKDKVAINMVLIITIGNQDRIGATKKKKKNPS